MRTPEEIAVANGLFNTVESVYDSFGLQITRDCYKHTARMIIKSIQDAQTEAWNEAWNKSIEE